MKYFSVIFLVLFFACSTNDEFQGLEMATATLYYQPDCATINGYIDINDSDQRYVFQHQIEEEFQGMGIEVNVTFRKQKEAEILTNECLTAPIIIISSLELQ